MSEQKIHWRAATDSTSNYFTVTDILATNQAELVVRVESAASGVLDGHLDGKSSKKRCVLVKFEGFEKKLGLNVTNATAIQSITGSPYYADWNKSRPVLTLYVEPKTSNGKPGVRIREVPAPDDVRALFEAIDSATTLAALDEIKPKCQAAPKKFHAAIRLTIKSRVAQLTAVDAPGSPDE